MLSIQNQVVPKAVGYLDILAAKYPTCLIATYTGTYASLTVHPGSAPLPTQAQLDADIAADFAAQQAEVLNAQILQDVATAYRGLAVASGIQRNADGTFSPLVVGAKQVLTGKIPAALGTTTIPLTLTPPLITSGTQLFSQVITPSALTSKVMLDFSMTIDASVRIGSVATVWRDAVCIGVVMGSISRVPNLPSSMCGRFVDVPNTTLPVTYSVRYGLMAAGTWYVNRNAAANFGTLLTAQDYVIQEL